MKQQKENSNLKKIRDEMERRLIIMRYSKELANSYKRIFGWVEDFLEKYGETNYFKEMGQKFLQEYPLQSKHSQPQFKNARTVIRRIDEILENKMFTPCFRETKMECPLRFAGPHEKYLEYLVKRGYSKSTIASRKMYSGRLFGRLPETVLSLENLTASVIYGVFTKNEWPSVGLLAARDILSYLFESSVTKTDLSLCVPRPRRPRALPSVYSGSEVERVLSSVDRTTGLGKRDYAVLILAAHLGLRSSDIMNLSFKNIDCKAKTIETIQVKTGSPLTLVMNSEVEEAINDYIQNGRPQSSSEKIFLGSQAPFLPLAAASGYAVAQKYFSLAGIAPHGRRRGTHALRASYATALVAKGIPYAVVQEALGHDDPESAKYYVRIDVKRLRMCALDVPKPIGAFAVMLEDLEGVL
jgi:site-specific recombinase XerD